MEKPSQPPADGERRHLTVLFCDLVSSTEIAARLDPEDWHAIAADYQRTAASAVTTLGGHVAKYLGDGLVVYFGYPEAQEDAVERGVRAGLSILESMKPLNARFAKEHNVKLQVRVGIHAGTVVVAHGGGKEADMFGDAPNIAARVQSAAEPDSVVITAAVQEIVSGLFSLEDRGAHQLKGIDKPVQLYRVLSAGLASGRGRGFSSRPSTPFVGRRDEVDLLMNRWGQVRDGSGQLVLATGEPGIGKTRLLEDFKDRIKSDPHLWVECFGVQFFASTPFYTVTQMLSQGLAWRGSESPEERVEQLERALQQTSAQHADAVPLIAELLGLPLPSKYPVPRLSPEQKRQRLFDALATWVFNAAQSQPLVLAVEDLHWVDPSTMELLHTLADRCCEAQLLLLCTARPEFHASWPARPYHTAIALKRLDNNETRELISGMVARQELPHDMIEAVIKRTDGVPLFAEELARLMIESGGSVRARDIPATLHDSLAARLDRLGRAKEVAQLGAVIGREFPYGLLAAITTIPEAELHASLNKLAEAELINTRGQPPEATYQFKHALIQDAAYAALLKSRRYELHVAIALSLENSFPEIARLQPEMLAYHYSEARQPEKAVVWWRKAGRQSTQATAYAEALDQINRALEQLALLPESSARDVLETKIRVELATPLVGLSGYTSDALRANTERAVVLFQRTKEEALFPALAGQLSLAYGSSQMIRAVTLGKELFEAAEQIGDRGLRVLASWLLGMALTGRGRLAEALKTLDLGLAVSDPVADLALADSYSSDPRVAALAYKALVLHQLGFADQAKAVDAQSVSDAVKGGHSATIGLALTLRVSLQLLRGDHAALAVSAGEMATHAERQASMPLKAVSSAILGLLRVETSPDESVFERVHQTIDAIRSVGWHLMVGWLSLLEAKICLGRGRLAAAKATLNALQDVIEPRGHDFFLPELYRLRAELAAREGEADAVIEAHLQHSMALARAQSARFAELRAATGLARRWHDGGKSRDAVALLEPLLASIPEGGDTQDVQQASNLLAVVQAV